MKIFPVARAPFLRSIEKTLQALRKGTSAQKRVIIQRHLFFWGSQGTRLRGKHKKQNTMGMILKTL